MPKIEDLIAEMEDAGVDPDFIQKVKDTFDASPLRAEVKAAKAEAQAAIDRAQKAEQTTLTATFKELGIKAKPSAFALPTDLDRTDVEQVKAWALDQGLIEPPPSPVDEQEQGAIDRIASAPAGAGGTPEATDALLDPNLSEDQFWELAQKSGLTT